MLPNSARMNQTFQGRVYIEDRARGTRKNYHFNSIMRNFTRYLARMLGADTADNAPQSFNATVCNNMLRQSDTTAYHMGGIVIGTGAQGSGIDIKALHTAVTSAEITGEIPSYEVILDEVNNVNTIKCSRLITNISASAIDVTEIGMAFSDSDGESWEDSTVLFTYDVIAAYSHPAGESRTYGVEIDIPASMNHFFVNLLLGMFSVTTFSAYDTGGVERTGLELTALESVDTEAPYGTDTYGILAGTGDTAVDIDDYSLGATIENTSLLYNKSLIRAVELAAEENGTYIPVRRTVKNITASTITIKEVGVYVKLGGYYFMLYRYVLPISYDIPASISDAVSINLAVEHLPVYQIPTEVADLVLWHSPDSLSAYADEASLASWANSADTGSGLNAYQTVDNQKPKCRTNVVGTLSAVEFKTGSAEKYFLSPAGVMDEFAGKDGMTIFIVGKTTNATGLQRFINLVSHAQESILAIDHGTDNKITCYMRTDVTANEPTATSAITTSVPGTDWFIYAAATSLPDERLRCWLNSGTEVDGANSTCAYTRTTYASESDNGSIGATRAFAYSVQGCVGEIIIYSRELTDNEVMNIYNYLAIKWSLL